MLVQEVLIFSCWAKYLIRRESPKVLTTTCKYESIGNIRGNDL